MIAVSPAAGLAGTDAQGQTSERLSDDSSVAADHSSASTADEINDSEQFSLDAETVERCGLRCRTVTANLTNTGDETATNVTTETRISADGVSLWERDDEIGDVAVNESVERTADVSIGALDAYYILGNAGWVTVNTTVSWDDGEYTFSTRQQVA